MPVARHRADAVASDAGLDVATERARYRAYQEHYEIESEPT